MTQENCIVLVAYNKGYLVDKFGNVWFNGRQRKLTAGGSNPNRKYYIFCIRFDDGRPKSVKVHKLQAYQKYGEKMFEEGIVVRHLNDDPLDNSYENIAIGTISDNMFDMPQEKRKKLAKHATSFLIKYDAEKVKEFYDECRSYKKTMEHFGIPSRGTLHHIIHNR